MGIRRILVSELAPGLCAYGQIISDFKYNHMAPAPVRTDGAAAARLDGLFNGQKTWGVANLSRDDCDRDRIPIRRSLDMRYVGQVEMPRLEPHHASVR